VTHQFSPQSTLQRSVSLVKSEQAAKAYGFPSHAPANFMSALTQGDVLTYYVPTHTTTNLIADHAGAQALTKDCTTQAAGYVTITVNG
jgi:hypothetical protein